MVTIAHIHKAKEIIEHTIHNTPIITSTQLNELCGNELFLKGEHLQKTGSFKIRGATNKVKDTLAHGVKSITTASSGNHGAAVAYIGQKLGVHTTVVVPENANKAKINAIKSYDSTVVVYGHTSTEREKKAIELAEEKGGMFIPPYDDPHIIAGQGTVGLEILAQVQKVDIIVVPIGGGGLISGIATAVKETNPSIQVIGVEAEGANDMFLSVQNNKLTPIEQPTTIADGLTTIQPGYITFPIVQKYVDEIVLVTEDEIKSALHHTIERTKQLIEPSSAVTIAAILFEKIKAKNKTIVPVISGGNVDVNKLSEYVQK